MDQGLNQVVHEFWESELPMLVHRDTTSMLEGDLIRDIVGPRRAGKTYLMFLMIKDLEKKDLKRSAIYLNFENRRVLTRKEEVFNDLIELVHAEGLMDRYERTYLFLDEVQNIKGWERYIRSIYDEFKGRIKVIVTGSSSDLLSEEYASLLTGRHLTRTVLPLSFKEYLTFRGFDPMKALLTEKDQARATSYFDDYLVSGGFPEIVLSRNLSQMSSQLFNDIIARDITSRSGVRNKEVVLEISDFLLNNVSNLISFGKMVRYFGSRNVPITVPTLIKYFENMKRAFLFFDSTIFSYSVKDQKQYPRKIYCVDTGFLSMERSGKGPVFENAVAMELYRRGHELHYWRDGRKKLEVDLVIRTGGQLVPVQVSFDMSGPMTAERELKGIKAAMSELGSNKGFIVTRSEKGEMDIDGRTVIKVPAVEFFLDESVLGAGETKVGRR